eukprot:1771606-Pleurochrysis_carterae.AAC.2
MRYVSKSKWRDAVFGMDMRPACSVQNTRALDKAQAADRSRPFDTARQADDSSKSAASAKAEAWDRVL